MRVETGPNASTEWILGDSHGVSHLRRIGEMNAPVSLSAPTGSKRSGSPKTILACCESSATFSRTSARWLRLTNAPILTPSAFGSPTVVLARRADKASWAASIMFSGTKARRIAVHFWPAFTVISLATSLMNSSNSGVSVVASGPSTEAFKLSCSATKRTEF